MKEKKTDITNGAIAWRWEKVGTSLSRLLLLKLKYIEEFSTGKHLKSIFKLLFL